MGQLDEILDKFLDKPSDTPHTIPVRVESSYKPLHTFALDKQRSYKQQYGDMYFLRLAKVRPAVEEVASAAWDDVELGGEVAKRVDRVLDVRQGELCWVAGTVYMDMRLKPNILEDVSRDNWIGNTNGKNTKYYSDDNSDQTMLEDDSGRIRLVGDLLKTIPLVTGCIIAAMGTENANGELEVIDIKFPDLPPQPERWALSKPPSTSNGKAKVKNEDTSMGGVSSSSSSGGGGGSGKKIALVSGLSFSGADASYALELNLLLEYLLGEALSSEVQKDICQISRLIIAGNSISTENRKKDEDSDNDDATAATSKKEKAGKKYGYDASSYNPLPSQLLDEFLAELLPSMPVTLLPGAEDPANASYPQQPIHTVMFPSSRAYSADPSASPQKPGWLDSTTNPWEAEIEGWRFLGTGGQNVDDVFKYLDSDDRLGMMEAMCRWRCSAPTAPDTLWSYPFQDDDPFIMKDCPHVYFVGCQPEFATSTIEGPDSQSVRLIAIPSFAKTKEMVLLDTETLEVSVLKISIASA